MLSFSLELKTVPVAIGGGRYELREFSGAVRDRYINAMTKRVAHAGTDKATVKNFDGLQADLLTLCLHDSAGEPVSAEVIQAWPAAVVAALFKEAQTLNALGEDDESAEGND